MILIIGIKTLILVKYFRKMKVTWLIRKILQ